MTPGNPEKTVSLRRKPPLSATGCYNDLPALLLPWFWVCLYCFGQIFSGFGLFLCVKGSGLEGLG